MRSFRAIQGQSCAAKADGTKPVFMRGAHGTFSPGKICPTATLTPHEFAGRSVVISKRAGLTGSPDRREVACWKHSRSAVSFIGALALSPRPPARAVRSGSPCGHPYARTAITHSRNCIVTVALNPPSALCEGAVHAATAQASGCRNPVAARRNFLQFLCLPSIEKARMQVIRWAGTLWHTQFVNLTKFLARPHTITRYRAKIWGQSRQAAHLSFSTNSRMKFRGIR